MTSSTPGQPQAGATAGGPGAAPAATPTATASNGGQPDYSAQWAEYYRSIGKHKEAEAIEAQMKSKVSSLIFVINVMLVSNRIQTLW